MSKSVPTCDQLLAWAWPSLKGGGFDRLILLTCTLIKVGLIHISVWLLPAGPLPGPAKSGLILAIPVTWNVVASTFADSGAFLFLLLNYLMISVRRFSASISFCLILWCNSVFSLCLFSKSVSLLSTEVVMKLMLFLTQIFCLWCHLLSIFVLCIVIAIHAWLSLEHAHRVNFFFSYGSFSFCLSYCKLNISL